MPRFVTFTCLCTFFLSEPIIFFKLKVYAYNTRRKRNFDIQSYKTDIYTCKRNVINMGFKLHNKLPDYIKETESYKTFRKQLK
jgi:hypothetical protein